MMRSSAFLACLVLVLLPAAASADYESGACCFESGACMILSLEDCYAMPGAYYWRGGDDCDPNWCEVLTPWLACCLPDGSCLFMNYLDCESNGGMVQWWGSCDPYPCGPVPVEDGSWGLIKRSYR